MTLRPLPLVPRRSTLASAVLRFVLGSLATVLVLGTGTVLLSRHVARAHALSEAELRGAAIADTIAGPLVDTRLRAHDPRAVALLNATMNRRLADGSVRHVKVWGRDGVVVWSDEKALVGRRFDLPEDVRSLFGTHKSVAELSRLDKAENVGERSDGELLEVYAGTTDADGDPIVFEAYLTTARMQQDVRALVTTLLPLSAGALVLFLLAVLPLGLSLARRVQRGEVERSRMMRHAILASDLERRRIAEDLHDGVIQDLAGLGYALPVVASRLADAAAGTHGQVEDARAAVARAAEILQHDVAALRGLMTDIYPPDLAGAGLVAALHDLAGTAAEAGLLVDLDVDSRLVLSDDASRLAYRVVREGLRNVVKHAGASCALVTVTADDDGRVRVEVDDDGRGPARAEAGRGHLGLRLLADTVRDLGGSVELEARCEGGARLRASFPGRPVPGTASVSKVLTTVPVDAGA